MILPEKPRPVGRLPDEEELARAMAAVIRRNMPDWTERDREIWATTPETRRAFAILDSERKRQK